MNLTGRTLGKYKLVERLGQGGMAQVYKAVQPTIERTVAIKVLHSHLAESDDLVTRFKREARALGQLQHPNIVQVIDFDAEGDIFFMIVDYVPGPTLRAYLDDKGALSLPEALRIGAQLADALVYAHQKGTIHRDIKPANVIFRDEHGTHAVLTDFGIGRLLNDATMTSTGSIIGTPAYMSPEAVMGQRVDARTDIYSLGVILYEMATGRVPYTGDTPMSVIMKQIHEPLPSPRSLRPELPESIVNLIEKSLAKDTQQRFQSADELLKAIRRTQMTLGSSQPTINLEDLDEPVPAAPTIARATTSMVASESPTPADSLAAQPPPPEPVTAPAPAVQRGPLFAAAGVLIALLLIGSIWFFASQGSTTSNTPAAPQAAANEASPQAATSDAGDDAPDETTGAAVVPTEPAAPTATPVETVPLVVPGQMGEVRVAPGEDTLLSQFTLHMDRVPLPPADSHYELWIESPDGTVRNLGPLEVNSGHILASGSLADVPFDVESRILVSIEPDGVDNTQAAEPGGTLAFSGQLEAAYAVELQALLIDTDDGPGLLNSAREQTLLAIQHAGFSQDALNENNLDEAKNHAEHVVNILDGEAGDAFGDLNLDGQSQNPGDGTGVRFYLQDSRTHIQSALAGGEPTENRQYYAQRATEAITNSLTTLDEAIASAQRLVATDTIEEAQPHGAAMGTHLTTLVSGADDQETLPFITTHTLALASVPLLAEEADLPPPDALAETVPDRRGVLRLANSAEVQAGSFLIQMARVEPLPDGLNYSAWLLSDDASPLLLGQLAYTSGYATLSGSQDENLLEQYNRLVISVENSTSSLVPSSRVSFGGELVGEVGQVVLPLLDEETTDGKGALFGAEEQTLLAIQHAGFAGDGLDAGNLDEAKTHTEHVINILDGEAGEHFGDVNLDGQAQNPGDGTGVRGYLTNLIGAMGQLPETLELTDNQQFYASQISDTSQHRLETVDSAIEHALRVQATDTVAEAQPIMEDMDRLLLALLDGNDRDENGVIDPLQAEGSIRAMVSMVLALNEVDILILHTDTE